MTILSQQEARERVARGAAHLDQVRPGWARRIDVGTLTLHDPCGCIVGQLIPGTQMGESFSRSLIWLRVLPADFDFEDDKLYDSAAASLGFDLTGEEHASGSYAEARAMYSALQGAWIEAIADRLVRPSAVYVYSWDLENGKPPMKLYRVTGGTFDGSDVGAERLIELGIPVPAHELASSLTKGV